MAAETPKITLRLRLSPREKMIATSYFNNNGPRDVAERVLKSPFYESGHPLVAREAFYQDVRDLLAEIGLRQRTLPPGIELRPSSIDAPHYKVWQSVNHQVIAGLTVAHLHRQGQLNEEAFAIHQPEIMALIGSGDSEVSTAKGAFRIKGQKTPDGIIQFGIPNIVRVSKDGVIDRTIDCFPPLYNLGNFPEAAIKGRVQALKNTLTTQQGQEHFLRAVGQVLETKGVDIPVTLSPDPIITAAPIAKGDLRALALLEEIYGSVDTPDFVHSKTITRATLAFIADDFEVRGPLGKKKNWRDYFRR